MLNILVLFIVHYTIINIDLAQCLDTMQYHCESYFLGTLSKFNSSLLLFFKCVIMSHILG